MTERNIPELLNSLNKAIDIQNIEVAALKEQKEQSLKCIDMFCDLILSTNWYKSDSIRLEDIDIQLIKDTKSILNM